LEVAEAGNSAPTANKGRAHLRAIWRLAYRKKKVGTLPDVDKLKEMKRRPTAWTTDEFSLILDAAGKAPGEIEGIPARLWWKGLLLMLYYSGLRVGAAVQIETNHISVADGETWLFVPAENQKHRSDQKFKLPPDVADLLRQIIGERTGIVFPWPYRREALCRAYRTVVESAGLPCGRRDLFHKIHRLSATQIAARR
jgi:integrase